MGNCCSNKNKKENRDQDGQGDPTTQVDDIKFDKSSFIFQKDQKFRDNYLIGQSMGTGTYGEVRRCKNNKSNVVRAVKILRKDKLDDFEI